MNSSSSSSSSSSMINEFIKREVVDWDDELISTVRFKAFSGQRSDWEPKFQFWRNLIINISRRLGIFTLRASWMRAFASILTTLFLLHQEMCIRGDILSRSDLIDPTSGRMYQMLRRVQHLIGKFGLLTLQDDAVDTLTQKTLFEFSEAMQIGAQAIKENRISIEEVQTHLQELDENIATQKQVNEVLETMPLQSVEFEDEDMEAEFMKPEMELADETLPTPPIKESALCKGEEKKTQDSVESSIKTLININLELEAA